MGQAIFIRTDNLASVVDAEHLGGIGPRHVDGGKVATALQEAVVGSAGGVVITPNGLTNIVDAIHSGVVAPWNVDGGVAAAGADEACSRAGRANVKSPYDLA